MADQLARRYLITFCHQPIGICTNQTNVFRALERLASTFGEQLFCEKPRRGAGFSDPNKRIVMRTIVRPLTKNLINRMLDEHERCVVFLTSDLESSDDSSGIFDPTDGCPSIGIVQFNPNIITFVDDDDKERIINIKETS